MQKKAASSQIPSASMSMHMIYDSCWGSIYADVWCRLRWCAIFARKAK